MIKHANKCNYGALYIKIDLKKGWISYYPRFGAENGSRIKTNDETKPTELA
jgi:hypothetical protein